MQAEMMECNEGRSSCQAREAETHLLSNAGGNYPEDAIKLSLPLLFSPLLRFQQARRPSGGDS